MSVKYAPSSGTQLYSMTLCCLLRWSPISGSSSGWATGGHVTRPVDGAIVRMRARELCLPDANGDALHRPTGCSLAVLPLLYNRRHFGVLTALVAVTRTSLSSIGISFSAGPPTALLTSTSYGQLLKPFEAFGIFALIAGPGGDQP